MVQPNYQTYISLHSWFSWDLLRFTGLWRASQQSSMQWHSWYQNLCGFFSGYSPFFTQENRAVSPESSQSSGQTISVAETAGGSYACNNEGENMENLTDLPFKVSTVVLKFFSVRRSRGISVNQSCGKVHSVIWRGHDWECSWLIAVLKMGQNGINIFCSASCWKIPHDKCGMWISEGNRIKKKVLKYCPLFSCKYIKLNHLADG